VHAAHVFLPIGAVGAASTFSGDSQFWSESIEMTEMRIDSTAWMGLIARTGPCVHRRPRRAGARPCTAERMFGWDLRHTNRILGGWSRRLAGKSKIAEKAAPANGVDGGPMIVAAI
jgi:hypothetical protein